MSRDGPADKVQHDTYEDHDQVAVGKCPNCGYVTGDELDYRFPCPSVCQCGEEIENTTVADPETIADLKERGPA